MFKSNWEGVYQGMLSLMRVNILFLLVSSTQENPHQEVISTSSLSQFLNSTNMNFGVHNDSQDLQSCQNKTNENMLPS